MIKRKLSNLITNHLTDKRAIIILGPRRAGKTTLLRQLENIMKKPILWLNGDDTDTRLLLSSPNSTKLKHLVGSAKSIVIDEAQRIENIGICLKLLVDCVPDIKVFATGSSSFELSNKINEPLTGRKWQYILLPFSYEEASEHFGRIEEKRLLEQRLIYGYYPEVVNNPGMEKDILKELSESYLYKDILVWQNIKKPDQLERLVQALAFQIGNEVSAYELGQTCGLDNETVERYIEILEKAFIIFRLKSFSRNLRNELKKSKKIFFYDNGIRNAVIKNFNPAGLRNDIGALWENFMISERMKYLLYNNISANVFFWRTTAQQEIDYIEESDGALSAVEFKWNTKRKTRITSTFIKAYPDSKTLIVSPENFEDFLNL